jgi:hypothetical protein
MQSTQVYASPRRPDTQTTQVYVPATATQVYASPRSAARAASPAAAAAPPLSREALNHGMVLHMSVHHVHEAGWRVYRDQAVAEAKARYKALRNGTEWPVRDTVRDTARDMVRSPPWNQSPPATRGRSAARSARSPGPTRTRSQGPATPCPNYYDLESDLGVIRQTLNAHFRLTLPTGNRPIDWKQAQQTAIDSIHRRYAKALTQAQAVFSEFKQNLREYDRRRGFDVDGPPSNQAAYSPLNKSKRRLRIG